MFGCSKNVSSSECPGGSIRGHRRADRRPAVTVPARIHDTNRLSRREGLRGVSLPESFPAYVRNSSRSSGRSGGPAALRDGPRSIAS